MKTYVLIESRDPFGSDQVSGNYQLARQFAADGHPTCLFLIENGVLAARASAKVQALADLQAAGVRILADDFSLRERGIGSDELTSHVAVSPIDVIIDHLAQGSQVIWH